MNPEKRQRIEEVFLAAIETEPARRAAFCDHACGGNREMRDGFLYLLQQGSSSRFSVLIPDSRIQRGTHQVKSDEAFAFPPSGGSFEFNQTPGVETIYVFTAMEKSDPLAAAIERSIAAGKRDSKGQALLDDDAVRMLNDKPAGVQIIKLAHEQ